MVKLLDKLKDLFMDEIEGEDEFELEEEGKDIYKEPSKDILPKVMRDTIKEEENKVDFEMKSLDILKKEEPVVEKKQAEQAVSSPKFSFPIEFEDDIPSRNSRNVNNTINTNKVSNNVNVLKKDIDKEKETTKKVSELYAKKEETWVKPKFKATPVISPVYGVLDKNYRKDEVKERTEDMVEMKRPSKKVDFETVRKKAFGNLADEIKDNLMCENCELYKEVKKISSLKEDDLLYDMTIDDDTEVTLEKAYDNYHEFGVAYENNGNREEVLNKTEKELNEIIDEVKEEVHEEVSPKINLHEENIDSFVEEKSLNEEKIPSREEKKKESKVDADFFDLIDSMYKERVDD